MTATTMSRILCLVLLCGHLFAGPASAQDWFHSRTEQLLPVRYIDSEECASLLRTLVPGASISLEEGGLMVRGTEGQMDQVKELFAVLDVPLSQVILDVRVIKWEGMAPAQFWSERLRGGLLIGSLRGGEAKVDPRALALAVGPSTILAHSTLPVDLGDTGYMSLSDAGIELRYRPVFREPNKIESHIQIARADTRRFRTFRRVFKDGETLCIKGFLPAPNVRGGEAKVVLMLTPHLMR